MTGKEFKVEKSKIEELRSFSHFDQARTLTIILIEKLFQERKFERIVELFHSDVCAPPETFYIFEVAYSLNELGFLDESERVYEHLLTYESDNSVILNNLSYIKRAKNQYQEAFELIRRAYDIVPNDEIISQNYRQISAIVQEHQQIKQTYWNALSYLDQEDDQAMAMLQTFLTNVTREEEYQHNRLPIPDWKFSVLMETDPQLALVLRDGWLQKGYLRDTKRRGSHLVPIYEINPFLGREMEQIEPKQLPPKWVTGLQVISIEQLEKYSYFSLLHRIRKIDKKYRDIAERDLNELFLNYLMKNEKSVIVLAGSLIEVILLHYCEKHDITTLYLPRKNDKTEKRDLYECDLAEILNYLKEKKMLGDVMVQVGNISRIYRNFIHPGKELREEELLNQSKSELCFISAIEIINKLLVS
ncbi:TPR domain protein [Candidatus Moduliflexus flocculans]|uniref:TPR domain protein n=1 Tax=Candidatus Moduliflexus flocculans TaxID=1499966 RepID=A0A0S6VQJ1_9BACT|nr:TPR domain protein [Candidatus Moduliflexus flocculans]